MHAGAVAIGQLSHLSELCLAHCDRVDDYFTEAMGSLPHVTALNLSHCPDVTVRSLQRLPTECPHLKRCGLI